MQCKIAKQRARRSLSFAVPALALLWAAALNSALLTLAFTGRAQACSCPDQTASVLWPARDAQAIVTEPVFVIEHSVGAPLDVQLSDADGAVIALRTLRTLETDDCLPLTTFVQPVVALAASSRYELRAWTPSIEHPLASSVRFHTGRLREERTLEPPALRYHSILAPVSCHDSRDAADCLWTEVEIRGASRDLPHDFSFLLLRSRAEPLHQRVLRIELQGRSEDALYAMLSTSQSEPCVDYEWIDRTGESLSTGALCTPNKCARPRGDYLVTQSSCSTYPEAMGAALWTQVDERSCAEPPSFRNDRQRIEITYSDGRCSLSHAKGAYPKLAWLLVPLLYVARASRHRLKS